MFPVVAETEANRPAVNTMAMNIVPIVSDFLNMRTVLDISLEPTIREGRLILPRTFALIAAVGRDNSRVNEKRKIPNTGIMIAANVMELKRLKLENAKLAIKGNSNHPLAPTAIMSIVGEPIFSASTRTSCWRLLCASVGVISNALIAEGKATINPTENENRNTTAIAYG